MICSDYNTCGRASVLCKSETGKKNMQCPSFYTNVDLIPYKGEEVKTKRFEVVDSSIIGHTKDDFHRYLTSNNFDSALMGNVVVRELPEPSQDVEVELDRLFEKFDHLRCTSPSQPLSNCFKIVLRQFVADNKRPEPIKLESVETGVLDTDFSIVYNKDAVFNRGDKIDLTFYPDAKLLCKDIKTERDYSSILKNSIVKCVSKNCTEAGFFKSFRDDGYLVIGQLTIIDSQQLRYIDTKNYSIEILSLPEGAKCSGE